MRLKIPMSSTMQFLPISTICSTSHRQPSGSPARTTKSHSEANGVGCLCMTAPPADLQQPWATFWDVRSDSTGVLCRGKAGAAHTFLCVSPPLNVLPTRHDSHSDSTDLEISLNGV